MPRPGGEDSGARGAGSDVCQTVLLRMPDGGWAPCPDGTSADQGDEPALPRSALWVLPGPKAKAQTDARLKSILLREPARKRLEKEQLSAQGKGC